MKLNTLHWKRLFIGLLSINIVMVLIFIYLIAFFPRSQPIKPNESISPQSSEFTITTDKKALSNYVNSFLEKFTAGENINYYIELNDTVELHGELTILSQKLPFLMTFTTDVQPNGDAILTHKSIRLGGLSLPVKTVLEIVQNSFKFPDFVTISPAERQIHVALTEYRTKDQMRLQLIHFDLAKDLIELKIVMDK